MTIYTPTVEDKKASGDGTLAEVVLVPLTDKKDVEEITVIPRRRPPPLTCCFKLFVCAIFVLLIAAGAVAGYFIYTHFSREHERQHSDEIVGRCGVGIDDSYFQPREESLVGSTPMTVSGEMKVPSIPSNHHRRRIINQTVTVDIKRQLEKLVVPQLDGTRATILHDFEQLFTAIADLNRRVCFVLPLDKKVVSPPKSILDLIYKFARGYYIPNVRLIRRTYRAVRPAVVDMTLYGQPITQLCAPFKTYRLQKVRPNMEKHLLGLDGHDNTHRKKLGGAGYNLKSDLLGGDGIDYRTHGKRHLIGGDGHDSKPHGKSKLLGGDGHDMKAHGRDGLDTKRPESNGRHRRSKNKATQQQDINVIEATSDTKAALQYIIKFD